jgi:hypothetical protein
VFVCNRSIAPLERNSLAPTNAAFHYWEAAELIKGRKLLPDWHKELEALLVGDYSGDKSRIEQAAAECGDALDLVRRGVASQHCQIPWVVPYSDEESESKSLRQLGRLMCSEAKFKLRQGDFEGAAEDHLTVIK